MPMTELSTSVDFLDGVAASVQAALVVLDRQEAALAELPAAGTDGERVGADALARLELNLSGWQEILGTMAESVRSAQEELIALDSELRRSLDVVAVTRKYLQAPWPEATTAPDS